jgi:flavin-dependent dehydrogenase
MYDAIIIGARCAGSPTAMLLARKGYRVLVWSTRRPFRATGSRPTTFISQG